MLCANVFLVCGNFNYCLNLHVCYNPLILIFADSSSSDLVLFEAAGLLKDALIQEWKSVSEEDLKNLKTYLLNFVVQKTSLSAFVRERILLVVGIMVKRGSVEDLGVERGLILNNVEQLVVSGDSNQQMIGCSVLAAMMQEYANTVKSSDVGLRW